MPKSMDSEFQEQRKVEREAEEADYNRHVLAKIWSIVKPNEEDEYDTNNLYDRLRVLVAERERCARVADAFECEETSRCRCGRDISATIRSGK